MSDSTPGPADYRDPIDLRAVLARIDRDIAENAKFFAEARKLNNESDKLRAERRKFDRDWWIVPLTVFGAILAAVIARLPEIMHAIRWGIPQ
jgi:hypothetical protein